MLPQMHYDCFLMKDLLISQRKSAVYRYDHCASQLLVPCICSNVIHEVPTALSLPSFQLAMITDIQLSVFANLLGVTLFLMVILYHYIAVNNVKRLTA